ncbi:flagellar basal body P-ring formation chaperone FlgA [Campylobacter helveticus]|uniref:Flagella basal body P-ring formation protein FlgA n=1 Tax=Campylobacter helveticus TaxID=28898 RepID=A0AAX2UK19_9BACT|nr:flagellar basal body P-ring formation chaperone FlgA [Campylobacter helveticus]ARE80045.1 flagellar basal body P-ring biosynthesis protein [Campylobacter helveticus]MCR2054456.1 flagellar basal body P-ring formation chaperone FlgA [Campylobacter helveticus]MCR2056024.1 flagellar basal body P-ring formation chaperone FlgA [Campylobacter helveticus]MCR2060538.1 flagellar basal body P-ring formation chaperone FlgA [Campylobacter helveticus]MCR2061391.1 flagellar basal body P-ring formation cha
MRKICFVFLFLWQILEAGNLDLVKAALTKEYQNNFPQIAIKQVDLKITSLPRDFEQFEFLRIANGKFNKSQGFLRAEFKTPQNISKNVFFRYFIRANLEVLRSTRAIKRGDRLGALDYKIVLMDFDKVPSNALGVEDLNNLLAKSNINKNTILRQNMFKTTAIIKRNDQVIGVLKDSGVDVLIELVALQSANLGERIRVKSKDGKVMQGVVMGKNRVLLQ